MRKAILMMLITLVSSSAAAEWAAISGDEYGTFYADPATIRRAGNIVKMWTLVDFKSQAPRDVARHVPEPFVSMRSQEEYDCKEEQTRTLFTYFYSGHMARGEMVFRSSNPGKWEPVAPRTIGEIVWKFACGKR